MKYLWNRTDGDCTNLKLRRASYAAGLRVYTARAKMDGKFSISVYCISARAKPVIPTSINSHNTTAWKDSNLVPFVASGFADCNNWYIHLSKTSSLPLPLSIAVSLPSPLTTPINTWSSLIHLVFQPFDAKPVVMHCCQSLSNALLSEPNTWY